MVQSISQVTEKYFNNRTTPCNTGGISTSVTVLLHSSKKEGLLVVLVRYFCGPRCSWPNIFMYCNVRTRHVVHTNFKVTIQINQSISQFICRRQLNVNSHWRLLRVSTLKKPGLEAANKLVSRNVSVTEVAG